MLLFAGVVVVVVVAAVGLDGAGGGDTHARVLPPLPLLQQQLLQTLLLVLEADHQLPRLAQLPGQPAHISLQIFLKISKNIFDYASLRYFSN